MNSPVDPRRCPLCGVANACGMADGASTCWCFTTPIPPEVLERVPAAARDLACVCRTCAGGRRTPEEILALLKEIAQNR